MQRWSIGQFEGVSPLELTPAAGVRNPVLTADDVDDVWAGFVADPFVLAVGDRWHMFFEVFDAGCGQGRIGYAESADGRAWRYRGIILREAFHLSYPFVFVHAGSYFMVPETIGAAEVRLYRADSFPTGWRPVAALIGRPLADPTPLRFGGSWWLYGCGRPRANDELRLYGATTLQGDWSEHPASPVVAGDPGLARPGGRPLLRDGRMMRWAQDCRGSYGAAVRAVVVEQCSSQAYQESPLPIDPFAHPARERWNAGGMHHVDAHDDGSGHWHAWVDGRAR